MNARELAAPVALVDGDGRLSPAAHGWARRPIIDGRLTAQWPRKRRWHHWGVLDDRQYISLTVADLDVTTVGALAAYDFETGARRWRVGVARGGAGQAWPDVPGSGRVRFAAQGLSLDFSDDRDRTRLEGGWRNFSVAIDVHRPEDHETLNVVVAPRADRFLYTSKQIGYRAEGEIRWNGSARSLGRNAFAGLDYARGVWPADVRWRWAAGAAVIGGRAIAVNLGAEWTDGAITENAITIDGRLHKIHEPVRIAPAAGSDGAHGWILANARIDLRFTPRHRETPGANLGVLRTRLDHGLGRFDGSIVTDDGEKIAVSFPGWCEQYTLRTLGRG
jgi:hypothetical protein